MVQQAAAGLAFVHENGHNGIKHVHKDIKPVNFVIRKGIQEKGEPEWVCKITNLGYSRRTVDDGSGVDPTARLGTREWIAPELLNMIETTTDRVFSRFLSKVSSTFSISSKIENNRADNPSAVDNTSTYYPIKLPFNQNCDVWAMGGVIHFIFSGGQHPYGHSLTDRLSNIRKCKPTKSGRDFLAKISQPRFRVDLLVAEMIQEDPDQRPDMKTVLERIRKWQPSKKYLSKYMNSSDNLFESFIVKFMAVAFIFTVVLLFILYTLRL